MKYINVKISIQKLVSSVSMLKGLAAKFQLEVYLRCGIYFYMALNTSRPIHNRERRLFERDFYLRKHTW